MLRLLAPNELCASVLAIRLSTQKENLELNSVVSGKRQKVKLFADTRTSSQMRKLNSELALEKPFEDILIDNGYKSPFILPSVSREFQRRVSIEDVAITLNSFLVFCVKRSYDEVDKSLMLFGSFNTILESSQLPIGQRNMVSSAFVHLFMRVYKTFPVEKMGELAHAVFEFFSHARNIPGPFFEMLVALARKVIHVNDHELTAVGAELVSFIDSFVIQSGDKIPTEHLQSILQTLCGVLAGLDMTALVFFSHVASVVDSQIMTAFLSIVVTSFVEQVGADDGAKREEKSVICLRDTTQYVGSQVFITHRTFDGPIDLTNTVTFGEKCTWEQLLPTETYRKLMLISKAITSSDDIIQNFIQMCPRFFHSLEDASKSGLSVVSVALILLYNISLVGGYFLPLSLLSHRVVFDPSVTVFEPIDEWTRIDTLRSLAVHMIWKEGMNAVQTVLYSNMGYPLLFAELVHRFMNLQQKIVDSDDVAILSQMLLSPMIYYQRFKNLSYDSLQASIKARLSILSYLNMLLSQEDVLVAFFNDEFFTENYLSLMFEEPVRPIILSTLSKYLALEHSIENTHVINQVCDCAKTASKFLNETGAITMLTDLLGVLEKTIAYVPKYGPLFASISSDMCASLAHLTKNENAKGLVLSVLSFMTCAEMPHNLSSAEISTLETVIVNLFEEPSPVLFTKIVQLIAGQPLPSTHPSFTVRQPKLLRLLIGVFMKSTMLVDAISFIAQLCQSSVKNREAAHRGEFDLYLIDLLNEWRNDSSIPVKTFASVVSLFMMIAGTVSSVASVQKFMSLLCPIDGKYFPFFSKAIMKSFYSLTISNSRRPICAMPHNKLAGFDFDNMHSEPFRDGITMTFWLNVNDDNPMYKPQLLYLSDSKDYLKFGVFLNGASALAFMELDGRQLTTRLDHNLETKTWSFLAVSFRADHAKRQFHVASFYNGEATRGVVFPEGQFQGSVFGRVGGLACDSIDVDNPAFTGPIGIFQCLTVDQMRHLYELGPCTSSAKALSPICFFVPKETSGNTSLVNHGIDNSVVITTTSFRYVHSIPFCDILVSRCGIELLLPLFAQWNLRFADGCEYEYFPGICVDLLEAALLMGEEPQVVFAANQGFKILSHLLMSSDDRHITYPLYLKFVNILENLTCEKLRLQLLDSILLNIELWMKCNADNHRRIVKHWSRVLVPGCSEEVKSIRSFNMWLSALRCYYWYEPCEQQLVLLMNRCRGQELHVKECRSAILMIVHMNKLSEPEFRNLISHILTCKDYEQIVDLLQFLNELILEKKEALSQFHSSMHMLCLLQYLVNMNHIEIVCLVVKAIVCAHTSGLIQEITLEQHIDIILHQVCPEVVSRSLLNEMIEMTNEHPELFPLCSWMALNVGEKGVGQMLTKLSPSRVFSKSEYWAIYCVVTLYKCSEALKTHVARFLILSASGSVINLFGTVEVVGRALGMPSDPVKYILLFEYGNLIQAKTADVSFEVYEALMRHFLMFRCDDYSNLTLKEMYLQSSYVKQSYVSVEMASGSQSPMSPKESRRRARHSLRPDRILLTLDDSSDSRYSPSLAQKALTFLNPPQATHHQNKDFKTRRTSLMTLGRPKAEVEVQQSSPESSIVSLMPSQLDEKIAEIATREFSYQFGLRLTKDEKWEDIELAKQALSLLRQRLEPRYVETRLIISAFLVHFDQELVHLNLHSLKVPHNELLDGPIAFLNHHRKLVGATHTLTVRDEQLAFIFVEQLRSLINDAISTAPLRFMKHIIKFQATNSEKAFDIFSSISNDVVGTSSNMVADYADAVLQVKGLNKKLWRQFWRCVTIDRAPWRQSIPPALVKEIHYKRDMTICGNMCPVKLKQNSGFTDHMDASFRRDSGTLQTAQEKFEQYKDDLAKKYESVSPPELLEAVLDEETEQEFPSHPSLEESSCIIELPCELITVTRTKPAVFSLFIDAVIIARESGKLTRIKSDEVVNIFFRTRFHHPTAIEIFCYNGKAYFINFFDVNSLAILNLFRKVSLPKIQLLQLKPFRSYFETLTVTNKWVSGRISNFEYLMSLNLLSGRSFNDPSQYPIFPWVLRDYTSDVLDLKNPACFRDLSLPMGAMTEKRLHELSSKAESMKKLGMESYLYGSGATNPLTVYLWLLRMEPFTSLHIDMQSGRFDHAARLFYSIEHSWYLATSIQNDYRELIPEFFCSPEFLSNRDHFDLGMFNNEKVDDVVLPKWASSPIEFIYAHRKALESEHVTRNLNKWIDLIWGDKQRGEKAEKAHNIYLPQMYNDVWSNETLRDPSSRAQIEAIMCHVGQIPARLFDQPHPIRNPISRREPLISSAASVSFNTGRVIASCIDIVDKRLRVSMVDANGQCVIASFDAAMIMRLQKSRRASVPQKLSYLPRSSSQGRYSGGSMLSRAVLEVPASSEMIIANSSIKTFDQILPASKIVSSFLNDNVLMIVGSNKTELLKVRLLTATVETIQRQRDEITNISSHNNWVATANRDAELVVFRAGNYRTPVFRIPSFTASICCSAVNTPFHSVIVGTKDGSLMFCSLNSGSIVKIISTSDCRPSSILVTPAWGFVVVYMTKIEDGTVRHIIATYTINGDLVRTQQIDHAIATWSCFRTCDGFDFIAMADDQGDCYIFEAFYLNITAPFYNSESPVASMFYMNMESVAVLVSQNGKVTFVPVPVLQK